MQFYAEAITASCDATAYSNKKLDSTLSWTDLIITWRRKNVIYRVIKAFVSANAGKVTSVQ